jgi:Domain of unknown function (DUF4351)
LTEKTIARPNFSTDRSSQDYNRPSIAIPHRAMTQSPFDQLSKSYLEEFLKPIGTVERQYEVPGEAKHVDVWFIPDRNRNESIDDLGLLGEMVKTPCLIEPYHNPPTRDEIRTCLLKLLWITEDQRRKAETADEDAPKLEAPTLWVLASHISKPLLKDFHAKKKSPGIYTLGPGLRTILVSIDELPTTQKTLWIRLLGRDQTQISALREVSRLPKDHPRRNKIIRLLASWGVKIETGEIESFLGQEIIMGFSQAFLEWEEATEQRGISIGEQRGISIGEQRGISIGEQRGISIGEQRGQQEHARSLVLRLLARRIGILPAELRSKVEQLSVIQLDLLSEALLDFEQLADLTDWLDEHWQA